MNEKGKIIQQNAKASNEAKNKKCILKAGKESYDISVHIRGNH